MQEGVIKFHREHRQAPLDPALTQLAGQLDAWRSILLQLGLLGRDPQRYEGLGFGNVSARVNTTAAPFLISGSQTGGKAQLTVSDFCLVTSWDIDRNSVASSGETVPSSETLTHGAFYGASTKLQYLFHAHSPQIWRQARSLGLRCTAANVSYGTPEMARAVARICNKMDGDQPLLIVMQGHEDGVFSAGRSAEQAGCALITALARARAAG